MKTKNKLHFHIEQHSRVNIRYFFCLMLIFFSFFFSRNMFAGCLIIECDADGIPIYLNGVYTGKTPVNILCDLDPQEYIVTFFPPLADSKIRYLDKETYIDILNRSSQSCFIIPGDTTTVFMQWQPIMLELAHLEKDHRRTQWTLMGVAGLAILGFLGVWMSL